MALTVLFAALATALWAALSHQLWSSQVRTLAQMSTLFFLTVLASWAILVPAKFWTERRGGGGGGAGGGGGGCGAGGGGGGVGAMMVLGGLVGLTGLWLDGWALGGPAQPGEELATSGVLVQLFHHLSRDAVTEASYFSYYALAFFALRWWRMTARHRPQRFSFAPILAAGFWGVVLLLVVRLQEHGMGAVVLVLTAVIVQLVSPWEPLPAPERQPRRVVLRTA